MTNTNLFKTRDLNGATRDHYSNSLQSYSFRARLLAGDKPTYLLTSKIGGLISYAKFKHYNNKQKTYVTIFFLSYKVYTSVVRRKCPHKEPILTCFLPPQHYNQSVKVSDPLKL